MLMVVVKPLMAKCQWLFLLQSLPSQMAILSITRASITPSGSHDPNRSVCVTEYGFIKTTFLRLAK